MSPACLSTLQHTLQPVVDQGADYLVLGCTHYPFLRTAIESLFGQQLTLIDSGFAVARQTARILIKNGLSLEQAQSAAAPRLMCYVSGQNAEPLRDILKHLLPEQLSWDIANLDKTALE